MDGPVGGLVERAAISHSRPAHIHFLINVPGFEALTTHLLQEGDRYPDGDVVLGTEQQLVTVFEAREPGTTPDGGSFDAPGWSRGTTSCCSGRPDRRAPRCDSPLRLPPDSPDGRLRGIERSSGEAR